MTAKLRLPLVLAIVILTTLALLPLQIVSIALRLKLARKIPMFWHRVTCRAIGIRVDCRGKQESERPLLLVANHVSWSDILVLGSLGEVTFVAKHEVSTIPGASLLARLQRTIFVVRENRHHSGKQAREITKRLLDGETVVLFAEGTTGDGNRLLEFKSALFGAAQYAVRDGGIELVHVQPVAIRYTALHGVPLDRYGRSRAAWTGDEELGPHLADFVTAGHWDVSVSYGESLPLEEMTRRRDMALQTRECVRNMLTNREATSNP